MSDGKTFQTVEEPSGLCDVVLKAREHFQEKIRNIRRECNTPRDIVIGSDNIDRLIYTAYMTGFFDRDKMEDGR